MISVLDAAGFQRILIETVGVGQAEVDIASAAHTTIVVEAPGMGDEVQAIKAGVLEIADVFAVNKADREGADHTAMALQMMQGLAPVPSAHHGAMAAAASQSSRQPGAQPDGKLAAADRQDGGSARRGCRGATATGSKDTPVTCERQMGWRSEKSSARRARSITSCEINSLPNCWSVFRRDILMS